MVITFGNHSPQKSLLRGLLDPSLELNIATGNLPNQ